MAIVSVRGVEYHIDDKLIVKWDRIKDGGLAKIDEDRVYVVDGRERSGKSLFTIQQAAYIDPTILDPDQAKLRIVFTAEGFLKAVRETQSDPTETKSIIFDEAFRGLSSRAGMSKINKAIIQALMEMGQKNLVVWIVLPSFFMLDLYPAMVRSHCLFHIVKKKNSRLRSFHVYSYAKKAQLYQIGLRKGWQYKLFTQLNGRFPGIYPGGNEFEAMYRQMKKDALESMPETVESARELYQGSLKDRNKRYTEGAKDFKTYTDYHKSLQETGDPISLRQLTRIVPKEALKARETP